MTIEEREQFDRQGYLLLPGVLSAEEVAFYNHRSTTSAPAHRRPQPEITCTCFQPSCTARNWSR